MTDSMTTWIVQQAGVTPRTFLGADRSWGGAATAERFETEEQAMLTECPEGTTGLPMRLSYHPYRALTAGH